MKMQYRRVLPIVLSLAALMGSPPREATCQTTASASTDPALLFCIGTPDRRCAEFGLARPGEGYTSFAAKVTHDVVYTVGQSDSREWPYIHPAPLDTWAGGRTHSYTVHFTSPEDQQRPLFLILGLAGGSPHQRSQVVVKVNSTDLPGQIAPVGDPRLCFQPTAVGQAATMIFDVPAGSVRKGNNALSIRLDSQSWIIYDFVALSVDRTAPPLHEEDLLSEFHRGPMAGVSDIVFAVRTLGQDPHWYANFGTTLDQSDWPTYGRGGRLCRLNIATGTVHVLLDDPDGGVRDPVLSYDAKRILFSYRQGKSAHYLLYEIGIDGSGLRQLTDGPFDDIEPIYLPDGDILFVSSRCKRCVNCHTTNVAVLYRCDANGGNLRPLSSNNEHDNTPWLLPGGQILYTRWEYVDRNQMAFHHLWITSPDGSRQTVFYGNQQEGITMIDAKPIPGSSRIIASFSPGHGLREHDGTLTIVDPRNGPDDAGSTRPIASGAYYRDPWAFSEEAFIAARGTELVLIRGDGAEQTIYALSDADAKAGLQCHEPRPVLPRNREPQMAEQSKWAQETGRVFVSDVYQGRNMTGVKRGEIKKLLVLETLPKPMNYTGGMEPLSYGGTFTLERILGTIPVAPDGSVYAEVPALRSLFFVALDDQELSVKRMQSFFTVMPGETTGCVGCHEPRTQAPPFQLPERASLRREPDRIAAFAEVPEVIDFPRDVQPVFNTHCMPCHDEDRRDGGVSLSGDRGPIFSISYYNLTARNLVADGRNGMGNRAPRTIGSSASRLLRYLEANHYQVQVTDREKRLMRLWIDSGAAYPGTYAALGTGMIGKFEIVDRSIRIDRSDLEWPEVKAAVESLGRRCAGCHQGDRALPVSPSHVTGRGGWGTAFQGAPPWVALTDDDPRRRYSRHLFYNLSRPEKSLLLLAPLAKSAGGFESCGPAVFHDTTDPDYVVVLQAIQRTRQELERIKRFDMPGFLPRMEYVRELKRFGILPAGASENDPLDVYAADRRYWESLWYRATAVN
jgi:hypothetical protein